MADEKPAPVFDIVLGSTARESAVSVNGQDITKHVCGVSVECNAADGVTKVTLRVRPFGARVTVQGAIEDVKVIDG